MSLILDKKEIELLTFCQNPLYNYCVEYFPKKLTKLTKRKVKRMSKEEIRRVAKVLCISFGLAIAATGLVFLWFGRAGIMDMITERKPAYSALEVGLDELHVGDHVTVDTSVVADYVLEGYESLSSKGYVNYETTWRYYLIPVIKSDEQRIYLDHMVLVSKKGKYKELNEASKAFFEWWNSEDISMDTFPSETVLSVDGRVVKLTSEELQFVKDYFGDPDYEQFVAPYVIKPLWDEGSKEDAIMGKIEVIMGAAAFVIGLILLSVAFLFGRKNGQKSGRKNGQKENAVPYTDMRHGSAGFKKYMDGVVKKLSAEQKAEVVYLINSGKTLEAIKAFRDMTGIGLAQAKDAVDHYDVYLK